MSAVGEPGHIGPTDGLVARLDFPMFVVTVADGDERSGCLAGFVTQCSIEPVRYLVCISLANHTARVAQRAGSLALHLLGADQHHLAAVFGELTGDVTDKFSLVGWRPGATGAPLLADCSAWVEGPILDRVDLGDHRGHLVEPLSGGTGRHPGLLAYSAVRDLEAAHPADEVPAPGRAD